ncbi:hypothetical protein [Thaumasiovibrio subtropicus]|uniref:hypothetical protein n=1 Tax=Thaumasiovibrio subtropicus TaxID=1891207 RepID=UPI000B3524C0|nr:hypothetical protein [Thaumasiovibrio subtropicus]
MSIFDLLAENQIQDWNRRKAEGKISDKPAEPLKRTSFESQLYTAIVEYYQKASTLAPEAPKRLQIERQAESLRIQLMITLERNDMRHTAQFLAEELEKRRSEFNAARD